MFKWLGKMVAEKIVGVIVFVLAVVVLLLIWRYHEHLPSWREVGLFLFRSVAWLALATLLPWATFFLVRWVERADSNAPAAVLLVAWALADALLAWWLIGDARTQPIGWVVVGLAFCLGGLYNLIAANQIAERLQRR